VELNRKDAMDKINMDMLMSFLRLGNRSYNRETDKHLDAASVRKAFRDLLPAKFQIAVDSFDQFVATRGYCTTSCRPIFKDKQLQDSPKLQQHAIDMLIAIAMRSFIPDGPMHTVASDGLNALDILTRTVITGRTQDNRRVDIPLTVNNSANQTDANSIWIPCSLDHVHRVCKELHRQRGSVVDDYKVHPKKERNTSPMHTTQNVAKDESILKFVRSIMQQNRSAESKQKYVEYEQTENTNDIRVISFESEDSNYLQKRDGNNVPDGQHVAFNGEIKVATHVGDRMMTGVVASYVIENTHNAVLQFAPGWCVDEGVEFIKGYAVSMFIANSETKHRTDDIHCSDLHTMLLTEYSDLLDEHEKVDPSWAKRALGKFKHAIGNTEISSVLGSLCWFTPENMSASQPQMESIHLFLFAACRIICNRITLLRMIGRHMPMLYAIELASTNGTVMDSESKQKSEFMTMSDEVFNQTTNKENDMVSQIGNFFEFLIESYKPPGAQLSLGDNESLKSKTMNLMAYVGSCIATIAAFHSHGTDEKGRELFTLNEYIRAAAELQGLTDNHGLVLRPTLQKQDISILLGGVPNHVNPSHLDMTVDVIPAILPMFENSSQATHSGHKELHYRR